jgi:hypothetical protein
VINESIAIVETVITGTLLATGFYETLANKIRKRFGNEVEDV